MNLLVRHPARRAARAGHSAPQAAPARRTGVVSIGDVRWRQRARVAGRLRSVRVQPWGGVPTLECTLVDDTGGIEVVFLGRREVAGIRPGSRLVAEGILGAHQGRLALLNPDYELEA